MKRFIALLAIGLVESASQAQSVELSPAQILQQQSTLSQSFYDKHAYAEAAAVLEKLSADSRITALPDWPERLYDLACDQALAGQPAQALVTLKQAVHLGSGPYLSTEHFRNDSDLTSLHNDPQFQELLNRKTHDEALWRDDPAIVTAYKPVLTEDEKVAGLSKFWAEARFNFPFFDRLPDMNWDRLYMEYLPQVRAAQTTADYYRVMIRFAAALHDGHTEIRAPKELADAVYAMPPMRTQLVEGKVLVTEIYDPSLVAQGMNVGAEIVTIDGQSVRQYAEGTVAPYASGSTPQDRINRTYGYMLLQGPKAESIKLTLRDRSGEPSSISVHRYCEAFSKCTWPNNEAAAFKMLPGNIAYLAVNEFENDAGVKTMRDNFASIAQAKALIVDVRKNFGGNQQNAMAILSMLTDKPIHEVSVRTLDYRPLGRAWGAPGLWNGPGSGGDIAADTQHCYSKPVIVLAGAGTFSAAENFVVVFDAMHRGTVIGETTPGSTGDSVTFKLPGGGSARIMMADVEYPDGRVFEGIGVSPQVNVAPSVSDIRLGKDAALERAISILQ